MKIKKKGKVHPSPSSSSSSPATHPILSNLPPTVLFLAFLLPTQDIQVLSYLLARSLHHSTTPPSSSSSHRSSSSSFNCDCFECYTVYWLRWDSYPNRDLIHCIIDAFEDPLSSSSFAAGKSKVGRRRGKDRNSGRDKKERLEMSSRGNVVSGGAMEARDCVVAEREKKGCEENANEVTAENTSPVSPLPAPPPPQAANGSRCGGELKGLARKVLPDVLGILNSRLWNLWSPDV